MVQHGRNETYDRGLRAFDSGQYDEAISYLESCIHETDDPAVLRLAGFYLGESFAQLGLSSLRAGRHSVAVDYFIKALRLNPNHADVFFNMSVAREALGDSDGQIKALRNALKINPRYAKAMLHEGIWTYEQGDFVKGMARIKEAVALDEGLNTERYRFALECHEKGQKARALANLRVLESADASDANAHARTGNEFAKQGLWLEAAQEYERGLRFAPRYADLRCRYGSALRELGRSDDAIEQLRIALEINPNYADAHAEIGMVYRQLGNDLLAKAAFERALTINPYQIVARQFVALDANGQTPSQHDHHAA